MDRSENEWVFDSLVEFLHGPVWNAPLYTFIEEKSLPFQPTEEGKVPDRVEYRFIHDEYKNLVDIMLGSFMEDIGISPRQFEEACQMSRQELGGLPLHFHRRLFQQIWAANDYNMFVRLMIQRNVELQLQALEILEQTKGEVSHPMTMHNEDTQSDKDMSDQDVVIMNEIKKLSIEEKLTEQEDSCSSSIDSTRQPKVIVDINEERDMLKNRLKIFERQFQDKSKVTTTKKVVANDLIPAPAINKIGEKELKERQEYLKGQRDKLVSLKKQIRSRQLASVAGVTEGEQKTRVTSAGAARLVLSGETASASQSTLQRPSHARQALIDRLKAEVVHSEATT